MKWRGEEEEAVISIRPARAGPEFVLSSIRFLSSERMKRRRPASSLGQEKDDIVSDRPWIADCISSKLGWKIFIRLESFSIRSLGKGRRSKSKKVEQSWLAI